MSQRRLLLVEDDPAFRDVAARALARQGFEVDAAADVEQALELAQAHVPDDAVVDLRLGDDSGLALIPQLLACQPAMRIVILTGYASVATAVEAIKLGAVHYLTKPVEASDIVAALDHRKPDPAVPVADTPMSLRRASWEHVQRVLLETDGNISEAARRLNMHRRTLQRKLQKYPPKR